MDILSPRTRHIYMYALSDTNMHNTYTYNSVNTNPDLNSVQAKRFKSESSANGL